MTREPRLPSHARLNKCGGESQPITLHHQDGGFFQKKKNQPPAKKQKAISLSLIMNANTEQHLTLQKHLAPSAPNSGTSVDLE